jgi:Uma2 family endonuclease
MLMTVTTLEIRRKSLAEVLHDLGDISPERIRMPVGAATEQDVVDALEAADKRIYELIDGTLVEKDMGVAESIIGMRIGQHLWNYLDENDLGLAFGTDGPFRVRVGRIRFPDVGFVSWKRLPDQELPDDPILDVSPDLAVEVISKGNTRREMELTLKDYFEAGVRLVWFIYPKTQTALVYTSPTSKKEIAKDQSLDGGRVLPGFSLPLKKLFAKSRRRINGRKP